MSLHNSWNYAFIIYAWYLIAAHVRIYTPPPQFNLAELCKKVMHEVYICQGKHSNYSSLNY